MEKADVARLAAHALAEQRARHGYPYEGRDIEKAWAKEHLPGSKKDFESVREAVRATGWQAGGATLAEVLMGGKVFTDSFGRARMSGGDQELFEAWTAERKKATKSHRCATCGAAAVGYSTFGGWACGDHYDEHS